ncbi:MAG: sigma-54-dependent Fis family transcriptional regulator [SAR324 cluster bacterium]|nr:sigma-54-dependent Fis family transcriptional regulator [SAR324 cluster bacterium]
MNRFEKSILIVDDEAGIRFALTLWFKQYYNTYDTGEVEKAIFIAENELIDIAVVDIRLQSDINGMELFKKLRKINPEMVVVLITGYGDVKDAVQAIKEGVHDYILKPIDNTHLHDSIQKGLHIKEINSQPGLDPKTLQEFPQKFLTKNREMLAVKHRADKAKSSGLPILLTGESGVGKEVLAQYIHSTSDRKDHKFVAVNCAAISETLLLSELFGHEKGAFTGATERKIGRFEQADQGTLFMDEVGDMSLNNQAALLRVLEAQSFERVGGTQSININVRVIAATNKNLEQMTADGSYREDLYYRINVVHLHIPPLRERKEDILLLLEKFTERINKKQNRSLCRYSEEVLTMFTNYSWPGNIRELNNVVSQILLFNDCEIVTPAELEGIHNFGQNFQASFSNTDFTKLKSIKEVMSSTAEEQEKVLIVKTLIRNQFNQSRTAEELQINRRTLFRKIQKYGISFDKSE